MRRHKGLAHLSGNGSSIQSESGRVRALSRLKTPLADKRGGIAILAAAALPALLGSAALGVEVSSWLVTQRAMQSAADSAALAASLNGGDSYVDEAKAVAAQYGFTHGSDNVTVSVTKTAPCTSGPAICYGVAITGSQPLFLSKAIGYNGNVQVQGEKRQRLSASATAAPATRYCLVGLASSGAEGIRANGASNADLGSCSVMSNTTATCNGSNGLGAFVGNAVGSNKDCGAQANSGRPPLKDSYARLASNIPSNTCASYPQKPNSPHATLPSTNIWSRSTENLSGITTICGDLQLGVNVEVNSPAGAVLVIVNGQLDLNNKTLKTANGSALTIVFTGTAGNYTHAPTGNGTLDIMAPTSGPWSGVAMYQDPNLTAGVNISAAGNSPTWNITGLVYLPHASVKFSGAVNKSSNGENCFVLVADNITVSGTGNIVPKGGCAAAGLDQPMHRGGLFN